VQRGQEIDPPGARDPLLLDCRASCATAGDETELGKGDSRLDAALIAALSTVVNGGLIPHARQGGKFVAALAVAGSKFEGTGFENVHIGQTQVALIGLKETELWGEFVCGR
jgi:hypothetical protein